VAEALAADGLTQGALARQAGVSATTVSQFLSDTCRSDVAGVAARLARWLAARAETAALPAALTREVLADTGVKAAIWSKLRLTHHLGGMCMVALKPGLGKTCTARAYAGAHNNVWLATMLEGAGSATMARRTVGGDLGLTWHRGEGVVELNRQLCAKLEGREGLLIVDEAQHLRPEGLEAVRQIHDKARVGVALPGHSELGDVVRGLKQLDSRMAWRLEGAELDAGDVALVAEARLAPRDAQKGELPMRRHRPRLPSPS